MNTRQTNKTIDFLATKVEAICSTDDLRSALNCVYFKNGFLYATDATIALKQRLELHGLNKDFIRHLDGKMLGRTQLKKMRKCDRFEIVDGGILSVKNGVETMHPFAVDLNYPDIDAVIPNDFGKLESIKVSAAYLKKLEDAMFMLVEGTHKFLDLKFSRQSAPVVVRTNVPEKDQIAIIMPVYKFTG